MHLTLPELETPDLEIHEGEFPADADAVRAGLRAHNARVGDPTRTPLCLLRRDEAGKVVGGIVAEVAMQWLYIDKFWIDESLRGQGLGTRLLRAAEERAKELGAIGAHLHTSSYQAPGFYTGLGYERIGALPGRPAGQTRFWFARRFDGTPVNDGD
ncbi:GNAT family N-acetyltransferase [Acetobacteraceae bacterium H6797]|nr:GNAT family N-acetyltransferase [Acetobacteraceae bacterium H6797]